MFHRSANPSVYMGKEVCGLLSVAASHRPVPGYEGLRGMCSALGERSVFETGSLVEVGICGSSFFLLPRLHMSGHGRRLSTLHITPTQPASPVGEGSPVKKQTSQCLRGNGYIVGDCMRRAWYRSGWQPRSLVWACEDMRLAEGKSLMRLSRWLSIRSRQTRIWSRV